jgi:hypothetical protein
MAQKGSKMWVLVLGAIIVVALFAVPAALKAGGEAWSDFWENFWTPFGNEPSQNETSEMTPWTGMTVIIKYTDGTSEEISQEPYSIMPFSITVPDSGKTISAINCEVRAVMTTSGTVSAWAISGTMIIGAEVVDRDFNLEVKHLSVTGTTWDPALSYLIGSTSTSAAALTSAAKYGGSGTYVWHADASLNVTATFRDGSKDSKVGHASGALTFQYTEEKITALYVNVYSTYTP